jgi:O-antigen/teichoic acid export membrane protein
MNPGNSAVSRNFAILSIGQMTARLIAFATTIHVAQVLLPECFGAVAFASGVLLYAGLLVDFGFDSYGPIEVSRGTSPAQKIAGTVLSFRTLLVIPWVGNRCGPR